jgi:beta-lactamase class A
MSLGLTRRAALGVGLAALARPAWADAGLARLEQQNGGRLGVLAVDTADGRSLAHRADERFTLCSTFKLPLAACVLARVDAGADMLTDVVHYSKQALRAMGFPGGHCPVTGAHIEQGALSVASLCQAVVVESDNLAANLLLARIGGPQALTAFLRGLGDTVTRCDRFEMALNDYSGTLDTTSPRAMAGTARRILLGDTLRPETRDLLESWMIDSQTGLERLRAAVPRDWVVADKTGTSTADEANDVALLQPPGRKPIVVAVYYNAPNLPMEKRDTVHRQVGRIVVNWIRN